ncbi:hypothetical protein U1Q18_052858 [Sarracenia purpurea var. burkii]
MGFMCELFYSLSLFIHNTIAIVLLNLNLNKQIWKHQKLGLCDHNLFVSLGVAYVTDSRNFRPKLSRRSKKCLVEWWFWSPLCHYSHCRCSIYGRCVSDHIICANEIIILELYSAIAIFVNGFILIALFAYLIPCKTLLRHSIFRLDNHEPRLFYNVATLF